MRHATSYQTCTPPDDIAPEAIDAARKLITDDQRDDVRYDVAAAFSDDMAVLTTPHLHEAFAALFSGATLLDLTPDQIVAFRVLEGVRARHEGEVDGRLNDKAAELVMDGALRRAA